MRDEVGNVLRDYEFQPKSIQCTDMIHFSKEENTHYQLNILTLEDTNTFSMYTW